MNCLEYGRRVRLIPGGWPFPLFLLYFFLLRVMAQRPPGSLSGGSVRFGRLLSLAAFHNLWRVLLDMSHNLLEFQGFYICQEFQLSGCPVQIRFARVVCQILRSFLFSASFRLISSGRVKEDMGGERVDFQAAIYIAAVNLSVSVSSLISLFTGARAQLF